MHPDNINQYTYKFYFLPYQGAYKFLHTHKRMFISFTHHTTSSSDARDIYLRYYFIIIVIIYIYTLYYYYTYYILYGAYTFIRCTADWYNTITGHAAVVHLHVILSVILTCVIIRYSLL